MKTVYVGMSGGVDSSVTAALLKEQGYHVVGVFMKNWTQDLPGFPCPWKEDFQDAKRVAVQLDIDFKVYDFETEYRQKVVDYMIREYQAGRTPNPDIMCNQEVKFKLFLETALTDGADLIATGHYARIRANPFVRGSSSHKAIELAGAVNTPDSHVRGRTSQMGGRVGSKIAAYRTSHTVAQLLTGLNKAKDQSYFLYRVTGEALNKTLFPLGDIHSKGEVRALAKKFGLATAEKKDSQGICFVGKVGIKEFLQQYVESEPGEIVTRDGQVIGEHDGAIFYTIGQRHGLNVGGGLPYYVVAKDMANNRLIVSTDLNDETLWRHGLSLGDLHWINEAPPVLGSGAAQALSVRTRYRAPLIGITDLRMRSDGMLKLVLADPVRAVTPGQSAVLYEGDRVVGGGICT